MKKTLNKITSTFKSEWNRQVLPDYIVKLENNIYIKICKAIGALSTGLIVSGIAKNQDKNIFYIICVLSFFYIFYKLMIVYYDLKFFICSIIKRDFIVRISPLDHLVSIIKLSARTMKTTANITIGTGITFALCHELDDILVSEGKEAYFIPHMKTIIRTAGVEKQLSNLLDSLGFKNKLPKDHKIDLILDNMSDTDKNKLEVDYNTSFDQIKNIVKDIKNPDSKLSQQIKNIIDKEDPFETKSDK